MNNRINMSKIKGIYFELNIENGIIKHYPEAIEYYQVGEKAANRLAECGTNEWGQICLSVMDSMAEQAESIKHRIISNVDFWIYPKTLEEIKDRKFEQAKHYVEGYSDAIESFSDSFRNMDKSIEHAIGKALPTITK